VVVKETRVGPTEEEDKQRLKNKHYIKEENEKVI